MGEAIGIVLGVAILLTPVGVAVKRGGGTRKIVEVLLVTFFLPFIGWFVGLWLAFRFDADKQEAPGEARVGIRLVQTTAIIFAGMMVLLGVTAAIVTNDHEKVQMGSSQTLPPPPQPQQVVNAPAQDATPQPSMPSPAVAQGPLIPRSSVRKLMAKCNGKKQRDVVSGNRPRVMCQNKGKLNYLLEFIGDPDEGFSSTTMMVGMGGNQLQLLNQLMAGVDLFQAVAGAKVGTFLPEGWFVKVPQGSTRNVYQGRVYETEVITELSMLSWTVKPVGTE